MSTGVLFAIMVALTTAFVVPHPAERILRQRGVPAADPRLLGDGPRTIRARWQQRWSNRRQTSARRNRTIEFCRAVAGELHAGAIANDAIERAARSTPGVADEAARAARLGGDVSAALIEASHQPGATGLARLAAAWAVSHHAGTGLADACEHVAAWLTEDEAVRQEVGAQLAPTRATARLLAVLPVLGLVLGAGMGARPLAVLFGTSYGWVCLVLGAALVGLGVWWVERLSRAVEDRI